MGLTADSMGSGILDEMLVVNKSSPEDKVIALAGNPNVGKSTVFNNLTGLNQHTGNWPGKTVTNAQGSYKFKDNEFIIVDIPGTYSILASSVEEEVARDFICFGEPDATVLVTDATCLERNLNLVLQTLEITNKAVVCVNLIDEAKRKKISIDYELLSNLLGVPVIPANARKGEGLKELMGKVYDVINDKVESKPIRTVYEPIIENVIELLEPSVRELVGNKVNNRFIVLRLLENDCKLIESLNKYLGFNILKNEELLSNLDNARKYLQEENINLSELRDKIVASIVRKAEEISKKVTKYESSEYNSFDRKMDKILTSKLFGIPIMLALLSLIFWITITGANIPSDVIASALFWLQDRLLEFFILIGAPSWLSNMLVLGMYRTLAWIVSVMLPPMAIFFPLFTLLEDLGYLPRIAFNLDNFFKKACTHGKQALTMCMGFGCNAAGIIGCRIIDSPRERLIAIITNNFVPCNGRFPTLIAIITMFFAGYFSGAFKSLVSALILTGVIFIGVIMTLLISKILSITILKGLPSSFTLELPPYRKPQIVKVIVRSIFDRTIYVLWRAVMVAAPAGLVIWLMANIHIADLSLLNYCANFLDPFARIIGMDGYILMAFILSFPANEIVLPIIIMSYISAGSILKFESLTELKQLLIANGWTWLTAICVMLFSLMHFPCSTACLTIKKETQSWKWTALSFLIPTITGIIICFVVASIGRLFL